MVGSSIQETMTGWVSGMGPTFTLLAWGFLILMMILFAVYLTLKMNRRHWVVRVFEPKSDGRLYLVAFDTLEEKRIKMGTRRIYWLKNAKAETTPPPYECVDRMGNKDYADYIKIRMAYAPIEKRANPELSPHAGMNETKQQFSNVMLKAQKNLRNTPTRMNDASAVESKFIYSPINKVPHVNVGYHQLEYDVDMNRINQIDNINEMFKDQENFWKQYGYLVIMGVLLIAVLIVTYLSYKYMNGVLKQGWDQTNGLISALKGFASSGTGGVTPPS